MAKLNSKTSIIIKNSPMPFVITSASKGGRRVWVRSEDATLELIGNEAVFSHNYENSSVNYLNKLFNPSSIINHISTKLYEPWDSLGDSWDHSLSAIENEIGNYFDDRIATYNFIWKGFTSRSTRRKMSIELDKRSADISKAIINEEEGDLEWHLSAIIALFEYEKNKNVTRKRILLMFSVSYLLVLSYYLLRSLNLF